jgi:hypothetical protein
MAKHARTTITVPADLKARMEAVGEPVNWSAIACQAFEQGLAKIARGQSERIRKMVRNRVDVDHKSISIEVEKVLVVDNTQVSPGFDLVKVTMWRGDKPAHTHLDPDQALALAHQLTGVVLDCRRS